MGCGLIPVTSLTHFEPFLTVSHCIFYIYETHKIRTYHQCFILDVSFFLSSDLKELLSLVMDMKFGMWEQSIPNPWCTHISRAEALTSAPFLSPARRKTQETVQRKKKVMRSLIRVTSYDIHIFAALLTTFYLWRETKVCNSNVTYGRCLRVEVCLVYCAGSIFSDKIFSYSIFFDIFFPISRIRISQFIHKIDLKSEYVGYQEWQRFWDITK